ncbi:hypothetical protein HMPREF0262_01096 [Clostridium sp. ATCC 29733]|nr:hypothetical protein HMPREF0262_01096 [Clostridium sp. ATCC 29733]
MAVSSPFLRRPVWPRACFPLLYCVFRPSAKAFFGGGTADTFRGAGE